VPRPADAAASRRLGAVTERTATAPGHDAGRAPARVHRSSPAVGRPRYYPMVCSIEDGAMAEVISAIDQLAADSGAGLTGADLRSRIAGVWAMLAALDPELARLSAAYEQAGQAGPAGPEH
jgi:hypothetical protein